MKLVNITHTPGESYVVNGIKKDQVKEFTSKNYIVSGSNGSYRVTTPSVTTLTYKDDEGKTGSLEFGKELKEITGKKRIYQPTVAKVNEKISGLEVSSLIKFDLTDAIKKALDNGKKQDEELMKKIKAI